MCRVTRRSCAVAAHARVLTRIWGQPSLLLPSQVLTSYKVSDITPFGCASVLAPPLAWPLLEVSAALPDMSAL